MEDNEISDSVKGNQPTLDSEMTLVKIKTELTVKNNYKCNQYVHSGIGPSK